MEKLSTIPKKYRNKDGGICLAYQTDKDLHAPTAAKRGDWVLVWASGDMQALTPAEFAAAGYIDHATPAPEPKPEPEPEPESA